ncbi:hypothetical protein FUAX_48470 (plasmid) [Fulvitalea axinellae]|uniref:non-reducing end alpha-L-arabinofuranosidase n=2 Tax=Fulvitalea axinellae TaxID=1182444 RepID=A0AAU9DMJ8_9BACT|nr:hypothetical protein FUAX_48470 [Fulvitalea axinellae]
MVLAVAVLVAVGLAVWFMQKGDRQVEKKEAKTASVSKKSVRAWNVSDPVLEPGEAGTFDEVAVKDPSVVFYEGMWHVFYTARGNGEYSTGYVAAPTLEELNTATRHELKQIRGKTRYGCAPQVFYYRPQKLWYLVFQNRDSNYQPVYSTTENISDPESWSDPLPLVEKNRKEKWIDFWVMADEEKMYMFYTQSQTDVYVKTTSFEEFPNGWSKEKLAFDKVHEAVHIYKAKGKKEYHLIYELKNKNSRSFGLAVAESLEGPWERVEKDYATGESLSFDGTEKGWTELVSHGEILRSGFDERMEYDSENCRWLIQGMKLKDYTGAYEKLVWSLGVMSEKK